MKKRIISILLMFCMVIGPLPTTAFAEGETTESSAAIQLGTSGISGYDSTNGSYDYIYFGTWNNSSIKWRVLDTKTNMPNAREGDGFFLLSDALLGTGECGDVYFDDALYNYSNVWQDSKAKTWCNNFYNGGFSDGERGAVLATTRSDGKFTCSTFNIPFAASENILNGDKVFFLSAEEAENSAYGFDSDNAPVANYGDSAGVWWLRSPVVYDTRCAGIVTSTGYVNFDYANKDWAARPAFNLNPNSVLFISAAAGGKSSDGVFKIPEYSGNEWKLTILDDTREFAITEQTASGKPDDTITLNYTGARTGQNEYISVIIKGESGATHYGRIMKPTAADGQLSFTIPHDLDSGNYKLYVFSEQYNGDYNTDYASEFQEAALTVEEAADEQFDLAPGGTYWFDLSGANIPGTVNGSLPDTSLHYVPFTYAGTVDAYKLTSAMATTEEYAQQNEYAHSLFIADYDVTYEVNWEALNDASLIFGKGYAADGVDYTLRAPSVGSDDIGSGDSKRGTPQSNEWDRILDKNSGYIKNCGEKTSWGQDTPINSAPDRAYRGYVSTRDWGYSGAAFTFNKSAFRPVLEVLDPDTLGSDGLKAVTLDLGGGKLGESSDAIQIVVKNGENFTAPTSEGLTRPDGDTGSYFVWLGSNGKLYDPGDSVPADVNKLTAQFVLVEQFSLASGGTYWFDLSGENIPGKVNDALPDASLHYVPFTYAGTVDAYTLTSEMATTEEYAQQKKYAHSLFIADYAVTYYTTWDDLNTAKLIFGKDYVSGGINYMLRAPSAGSDYTGSDDLVRGTPQNNEWDRILDKNDGYIKNYSMMSSWGQDTSSASTSTRAVRGNSSARIWNRESRSFGWGSSLGFRPILEVLNPDTLGSDGLKAVTLDLGGGKLGGSSEDIQIVVKNGESFTAPVFNGLTRPDGDTGSYFMWLGSDGNLYASGDNVPADVTKLTAQFEPSAYIVTITTDSLPDGKVGEAYRQTLTADGTAPITWSIDEGSLPAGLSLNGTTGEISGTPTAAGTAGFTVKASNSAGSDTKELSITIAKAAPSPEDLVDPMIRIVLSPNVSGYYAIENGENCSRTAADFFRPGRAPEGAKITAVTPPASASIPVSVNVDSDGTLNCAKSEETTEIAFKSETYTVTITGDDYETISAPLTVRRYLNAGFQGSIYFGYYLYGDTYTYTCQVTNPGENGVWSALIRDPEIFEICQETTDITSEPGKSIYTVQFRAIKANAGVTRIDFLYFSDTTMASSKDVSEAITGGGVSTRPLTVTAGSASITKGDALPTDLVTCTGLLDSEGRRDDRDTVLDNAFSYRLLDASGVEVAADTARNTPGTYTVVPAAALKSGWDERYALSRVNGTLTVEDKAEFTVTVTSGGNGMASAFPAKAVANTEITLTAMPDKGYHFKEWQVVSGGVTIVNNKFTMPDSNVELKAIFEKDAPPAPTEFTITFNGCGGTPSDATMTAEDGKLSYLPTATRSGSYRFDGWYTEKSGGTKITMDTVFSENSTVYARWTYTGGNSGSSSSSPIYPVFVASGTEKGTATVSPRSASKGDTVTITVKPDSGYVLDDLTVTDKNGNELKLTDKGNGKYSFTMPAGKVEVKATFVEEVETGPFSDVSTSVYYYEAVKWAQEKGITGGIGNGLFGPNQPCTRAQIVTFLWRAAGSPEPKGAASDMTDVVSGSYYEKAVAWAIENGITTGTTVATFSPDATCTRAQAVTFLVRDLSAKASGKAEFSDVPTDSYFAEAVAWAAANGVTEGVGGGLFAPGNDCTRAQIVTFLYRAYNK